MAGSIRFEKCSKPVVYVVADNFLKDALSSAEDNGMPELRMVSLPADQYYKGRIDKSAIRALASASIEAVIEGLTRTRDSKPTQSPRSDPETLTIKISAPSYDAALELFNQRFLDNKWGSGLPLMPPTRERVQWLLSGTQLAPDEIIGQVAPKNGLATVEKIAVNAAMAGARPEYLPVIIAAIRALTDPGFDLLHMTASTGSFTLQVLVSGPIAKAIGMNSGIGLVGYGWRANNTIGHAIRLCLINLGHCWPAENDMALVGRPSSHTCHVFAENADASPWQPYHTLRGFAEDANCVTVSTVSSHSSPSGMTYLGGGAVEPWNAGMLLDNMVNTLLRSRMGMPLWKLKSAIPSPSFYFFVLHPELALEFDRLGYDRKKLQRYLFEKASVPFEDLTAKELASVQRRIDEKEIPAESLERFRKALEPGGRVPLLLRQDDCHIAVAGGIPGYSFVTSYFSIPPYAETAVMTKEIR